MARRWTIEEELYYRAELQKLYVNENKTINQVGKILGVAPQTVFDRLHRLGIHTCRDKKEFVNNQRKDVIIPSIRTPELAELFGVLLGDGHVDHFQVFVNLGNKELAYAQYICELMQKIFGRRAKITTRATGHRDVYIGSTRVTKWLREEGLVRNKVASQVDVPAWIHSQKDYSEAFIRGFFDTDGSVYKLRYGVQVEFTNKSLPILFSLQKMLRTLGYTTSAVSGPKLYVTRKTDVERFFAEVKPANVKHIRRYKAFAKRVGTQAVNEDAL